jgi:GMP synthase-like glutamine amidotransferase
MLVLALTHEQGPCSGVFADAVEDQGGTLDEWSLAWGTPPPRPLDEYEAVIAFGGVMNTHEEHYHPWLREENMLMQRFLDQGVPLLGVCLGGQLIAKAAHAPVTRAPEPEVGWFPVELLAPAGDDPLFASLPRRLMAYQWHHYRFDLPGGGVHLAQSSVCLQAFRLGEVTWALQFHCEVTAEMVEQWIQACEAVPDYEEPGFDPARMREETERHIDAWNDVGREIGSRFLSVAKRVRPPSRVSS